jgi:site-specific DNA-methyltransferase (cytosine-N4-specific)
VACSTWEDFLPTLPADSVDLVFCSPPYEQARLYLEDGNDLGIARGTDGWVAWMVDFVRACARVCKGLIGIVCEGQTRNYRYSCAPFLLMAELHKAGFNLRKPPAYRRVGIPGSGGPDWLRNDYEPIVCVTRPGKLPWSYPTACGAPPKYRPGGEMSYRTADGRRVGKRGPGTGQGDVEHVKQYKPPALANPGNVIDCAVGGGRMGSPLAHEIEAPFPEALAEFFVRSFAPPGGLVLDPFCGSGTTGAVAVRHGRRFAGCDVRESQVRLSRRRIAGVLAPIENG